MKMGRLKQFLFFVLHLGVLVFSSSLAMARHLCRNDQSLFLLQFKQSINTDDTASLDCEPHGVPSYPRTMSWNRSTDCCRWDGVTCDELTGEVTGLDLSCSQLHGVINSNSTLFQLSYLQRLNLAYNDFSSSLVIPSKFGELARLTHLNLSRSGFSGQLPSKFLHLSNMISLDLSMLSVYEELTIRPHIFKLLLQNFTQLREVLLTGATIASVVPRNISASVTVLRLGDTSLYGKTPADIFHLPNLQTLELFSNYDLTGYLSVVECNTSIALRYLDLSITGFSGELPESIGHLRSLNFLDLSYCNFSGFIPQSLGNLTQMTNLDLSNNNFSGQVPSRLTNLEQLTYFDLSTNNLDGPMPNSFSNFNSMTGLLLSDNFLNGYFPSSIINLTKLKILDLSNNLLAGPLPSRIFGLQNMVFLNLAENLFNSTVPSWAFTLPSLKHLQLQSNQLTGQLCDFQCLSLERIDLSDNKLQGPVPKSISKLVNLTSLDLASNNLSGVIQVSRFSNSNKLEVLSLSDNILSLATTDGRNSTMPESLEALFLSSCGVKNLDFLRGANIIGKLDLSNNMLHGQLFSDRKWHKGGAYLNYLNLSQNFLTDMHQLPFQNVAILDLSSNLLQGPLFIPSRNTLVYFTSDNNYTGEIPPSICKLSSLQMLDLSKNNLSGVIPQCMGNMSMELSVLDMHMNRFHGKMPATFVIGSKLRTLNLRNNQLEGTVPRSLSRCRELEVLDIGNNNINGTFPRWLEALPKLQVLSLRSNRFRGAVSTSRNRMSSFPALRIIDLSQNQFNGVLPPRFFRKLQGMKKIDETTQRKYIGFPHLYQDSVMVVIKGQQVNLVRILTIFTTIDFSSNKFKGQIPEVIGDLISLRGLNLSHNTLAGQIPQALGSLTVIESLDLSSNQLVGQIPKQLAALSSLSVLNLSQNQLVGSIPRGTQFDTFENDSYIGNRGLCGFPLSKSCGANELPQQQPPQPPSRDEEEVNEEFFNGFTWQAVLIGYGCGMVIGMIMGCLIFLTGKPKWFNKIVQQEGSKLVRKKWPKYVKWL